MALRCDLGQCLLGSVVFGTHVLNATFICHWKDLCQAKGSSHMSAHASGYVGSSLVPTLIDSADIKG